MEIKNRHRVGEVRSSQLLFSYGVGSVIDLPNISAMIMGLDEWHTAHARPISEERLLHAVQQELGDQVTKLLQPPMLLDNIGVAPTPFDESSKVGVPVATFPRWMLCPEFKCRLLAPVESGLFKLDATDRPDKVRYVHINCPSSKNKPVVLPVRFLVACPAGHLDDFPWSFFVHRGEECLHRPERLRLMELGISGEVAEIQIKCESCGANRRMSDAFGEAARNNLPPCRARRPHLRDYAEEPCDQQQRTILLGASNSWFGVTLSTLSVPREPDKLGQFVDHYWSTLEQVETAHEIRLLRSTMPYLANYSQDEIFARVEAKKNGNGATPEDKPAEDLKLPEWEVLTNPGNVQPTPQFDASVVPTPKGFETYFRQIVQVKRLREVRALVGFTRIESPGDYADDDVKMEERRMPVSRSKPYWVPAAEVNGEGIFIQFNEDYLSRWLAKPEVKTRGDAFAAAHRKWRQNRKLDPDKNYPGLRFILLHSFSHALMRELTLECGYSAASIRERLYTQDATHPNGAMAGVLLYTAASDSEGTLGGLVERAMPEELQLHLERALKALDLCASDPLCAEHLSNQGQDLHGAACHACLLSPETSCERGNRYLDRTFLVPTIFEQSVAFFR